MRKKIKVLMVVENLSVPADPRVWREAQSLQQAGYQVTVICPQGQNRDQELYTNINNIHIYRYHTITTINSPRDYIKEFAIAIIKTFLLSLKVWQRHGFDVIHVANPPDIFFVLGWFYHLFGKKYIFDQHDLAPEIFHVKFQNRMPVLYKLLCLFERYSYRSADLVITTNESQRQCAIERGGCTPEKVVVVRNGPDITRFQPSQPDLALKRGKQYLLAYIGVMGAQDGVEYALQAVHQLVHQRGRQDILLALMGDGDQLPSLKELARTLKIEDAVLFTGWLDFPQLLQYLSVADIGISPDPSNDLNDRSTMLKTMEYMAMAKPVVAFDLPETRISAQDAALYATPNKVDELVACIEQLLDNAELRHQMGSIGRQRIEDKLSWNRAKEHLWQAYSGLFSKGIESQPEPSASLQPEEVIAHQSVTISHSKPF